jgi:hypothetical protein
MPAQEFRILAEAALGLLNGPMIGNSTLSTAPKFIVFSRRILHPEPLWWPISSRGGGGKAPV